MKSLLKNLGMILIIIGAVVLIACFATGNVNSIECCRSWYCLINNNTIQRFIFSANDADGTLQFSFSTVYAAKSESVSAIRRKSGSGCGAERGIYGRNQ